MKQTCLRLLTLPFVLTCVLLCASCETPKVISPTQEPTVIPELAPSVTPEPKIAPEPEPTPPPVPPPSPPPPPPPAPPPSPKAKVPEGPYFVHTVTWPMESLATIAAWYTGNTRNWRILADANPLIVTPNKIAVGTKVRIPEKMLRTREQMPQGFAESYAKPPK